MDDVEPDLWLFLEGAFWRVLGFELQKCPIQEPLKEPSKESSKEEPLKEPLKGTIKGAVERALNGILKVWSLGLGAPEAAGFRLAFDFVVCLSKGLGYRV